MQNIKQCLNLKNSQNYLAILAVLVILVGSFNIQHKKKQVTEASSLPFYNVSLMQVQDGTYIGKTQTSFLQLELAVSIKNHQLQKIETIEKKGSKSNKAEKILQTMVQENKIVVPAVKGEELACMVYISCVDSALKNGIKDESF